MRIYKYDPSSPYAANALNQYTNILEGAALSAPLYDADGNLTNYNGWTFTWDAENRLIAAVNGSTVVSNQYDYMSRRISKDSGGVTRMYVYDGWNLVQEVIGTSTNNYIWGLDLSGSLQGAGGIGGLLSANLNGTQAFYFYDANGNVSDLAGVSGNNLAHYEYDPYGNITVSDYSLASANPFRFSTKYLDEETGLYYYGFRYYAPQLGRWVSRDTLREAGGLNIYGFVRNSSPNSYDGHGLWGTSVHRDLTIDWALLVGIEPVTAVSIGKNDDYIDTLYSPTSLPLWWTDNFSWHFNRNISGPDSRDAHAADEFMIAEKYCTGPSTDDPVNAAIHLGYGLHPLQDWVAHGDYNRKADAPALDGIPYEYIHNLYGPDGISAPDNEKLDADGPGGRATVGVMTISAPVTFSGDIVRATTFHAGTARIKLTEDRTLDYLMNFQDYVLAHGVKCGKCMQAFWGKCK